MKNNNRLMISLILGLTVVIIVSAFIFINNFVHIVQNSAAASPTPASSSSTIASTVPPVSISPLTPKASTPLPNPFPAATPTSAPIPVQTINIGLDIVSVEGSGFSRIVTGHLTNSGTVDLHNSVLKIEIFSNGKPIKNDSQTYVEKAFNTIKAGTSVTDVVAIKLGLIDGINVQNNGANFLLTFTSDEKTQTFTYQYVP
jgi:hypothetical protein